MPNPAEVLAGAQFRGPSFVNILSKTNQFAGRTTLTGGSTTVTVSTTVVTSDCLILLGHQAPGTDVASGGWRDVEVKAINPGNAFVLGTADGVSMARDTIVMWLAWPV